MGRSETLEQRRLIDSRTQAVEIRMFNWCLWKALVPAILLAGLFPLYRYVLTLEHPFQRAFAHGDLILFASILLFEIGVETEGGAHRPRWLWITAAVARALAFLLMPMYWIIKHDVILKEEQLARATHGASEPIISKLSVYAGFSCTVAVASLVIAACLAVAVLDYHKSEELRAFGVQT